MRTLAYPDFSKPFVLYTDASDYQLGAVITQDGKPLAFYSRKLNAAQKYYTTQEKELLSVVETVKEFQHLLNDRAKDMVRQGCSMNDLCNLKWICAHYGTERLQLNP